MDVVRENQLLLAWFAAALGSLAVVADIARREFDAHFRSRTYGLRPEQLRDQVFAAIYAGILPYRGVARARLIYIALSVTFVAIPAGFLTWDDKAQTVLPWLLPKSLYRPQQVLTEGSTEAIFLNQLFIFLLLHAAPFLYWLESRGIAPDESDLSLVGN